MTTESQIEQRHRKIARAHGWLVVKIMHASPNGMPDRLYARGYRQDVCRQCMKGRLVFLEWKRPGGVLLPQQRLRHAELLAAGVEVHVVESVDEANRVLGIGDD